MRHRHRFEVFCRRPQANPFFTWQVRTKAKCDWDNIFAPENFIIWEIVFHERPELLLRSVATINAVGKVKSFELIIKFVWDHDWLTRNLLAEVGERVKHGG